jgi:serine protease Do
MKTPFGNRHHTTRESRSTFHVSRCTPHHVSRFTFHLLALLALAGILAACQLQAALADDQPGQTGGGGGGGQGGGGGFGGGGVGVAGAGSNRGVVVVKSFEPMAGEPAPRHDRSWLGVGVEEAPEALTSQLSLAPGVGLVVIYVAPDSPGAKAGLEKNDLLVELEGQALVHPAQLRKLVQVRKDGDKIELGFYRAGKKQTVSATLAKAPPGYGLLEDGDAFRHDIFALTRPLRDVPMTQQYQEAMKVYRDQLGHIKIDQTKVQEEVRHSLDQARRAMEEALRYSTNVASDAASKALRELRRLGIAADTDSTVTVRSSRDKVRSVVKADDSGTYVIVSNPKPRLTAHDKDGKLLFDGEIDTPEQREKVPPEVWEKVEPMLDKLAPKAEDEVGGRRGPAKPLPPRPPMMPRTPAPPGNPPAI